MVDNKSIFSRRTSSNITEPTKPNLLDHSIRPKSRRRRLHPNDPDFEPPDGGWAWVVCFACGLSNLCVYPVIQQFGLIFSEKFKMLEITGSETSTIININVAMTSLMGLINGPLFRKYSFRQVGMVGSIVCVVSIILLSFSNTVLEYILGFSILYGMGMGLTTPAYSLALNTYFKKKRRMAMGFSWTATGLGPVIMPFLISFLLDWYACEGTTLIFAGVALNAFVCSTLLQPVHWHTKYREQQNPEAGLTSIPEVIKESPEEITYVPAAKMHKNSSFISTQYIFTENDPETPGYEIIDPGTPMLCAGNDGLFTPNRYGSKHSLTSTKKDSNYFEIDSRRASYQNLTSLDQPKTGKKPHRKSSVVEKIEEEEPKLVLEEARAKLEELIQEPTQLSAWGKVVKFFDLDLLKDPIYVNIMLGITLAMFAEMNFSILTPFILQDLEFSRTDIATFMSTVGICDISVRFLTPFLTSKINLENRTFFLIGIGCLAGGRICLSLPNSNTFYIPIGILTGFGKALRTIFMALVIPSHVPLARLPAATGLQLMTTGLFCLIFGPAVGWLKDYTQSFILPLHFLSLMTFLTISLWTIEDCIVSHHRKQQKKLEVLKQNSATSEKT